MVPSSVKYWTLKIYLWRLCLFACFCFVLKHILGMYMYVMHTVEQLLTSLSLPSAHSCSEMFATTAIV